MVLALLLCWSPVSQMHSERQCKLYWLTISCEKYPISSFLYLQSTRFTRQHRNVRSGVGIVDFNFCFGCILRAIGQWPLVRFNWLPWSCHFHNRASCCRGIGGTDYNNVRTHPATIQRAGCNWAIVEEPRQSILQWQSVSFHWPLGSYGWFVFV